MNRAPRDIKGARLAGSQTLAFDIVGNASSAARAFKDTAGNAALAAKGASMASDAMKLQAKSAEVSAGATLALARADKILADAELGLARDMTVANAALGRQNAALLGNATAGAVGSMLSAAASGKAPSSGGGTGLAPGLAMAAAAMGIAQRQTRLFSDSISKGTPVWDSARKGIFGLNGELQLFGGALTSVGIPHVLSAATTVHLLTEAVVETAGTLIPAAIAFSAFGVAAVPTVKSIYQQMQNLYTISQATGTQVPGLTGNFSKMAAAVQPQVYQLFGEGLVFASKGTGALSVLATGAGKVLDDLGARFVAATTQGNGFKTFTEKATSDLSAWGTGIGNVGGIIGNLLKVLPGYAEQLASVFDGVTHAIEVVTGSPLGQWVLGIGLAAHGALFYVGLLATGLSVLASKGLAGIANLALGTATKIAGLGAAGEAAAGGLLAFGGAAEGAAALPWGWIAIAAAGFGFLVYQLAQAKDAAQQFDASMQSAVQNAPLNQLSATISSSIAATQARVASSVNDVTAALKEQQPVITGVYGRYQQNYNPALDQAATLSVHYSQGLSELQQQQQLVASRVGSLAKEYGGQANALALLNAAGITSKQVTDQSSSAWAQVLIELQATNAATKEMGVNTGALGSDYVNTLLPAVQKVTQAQDALLGGITGGRTALDNFQQGIGTLATNFAQAAGSGGSVNETLGKLKASASLAGATLGGTTQASYALNAAFYAEVDNGQKLIDSLEAQGAGQKTLTTATATLAGQMLSFAGNNAEARSVLVDMINNALGPGTVSMQNLDKWTGQNSTTLDGFNKVVAQSTIAAGNLAGTLSGLLNQAFADELLKASGATGATRAFADAVASSGSNSAATQGARAALIADLEKAGYSAHDAAGYVDSLQNKIDGLHGKTVDLTVQIHEALVNQVNAGGAVNAILRGGGFASGGMVTGGTPGKDSVPIMAMPGEVVVPAAMVSAGAVDHLRGSLPGFAGGGMVGGYGTRYPAQVIPDRGARGAVTGTAGGRRLSAGDQAIIAAIEANTAAVLAQPGATARSLNSVSSAAAARGSYSTRR